VHVIGFCLTTTSYFCTCAEVRTITLQHSNSHFGFN